MVRLIRPWLWLIALVAVAAPSWAQNFGIGILAPQQKLDVNGRVRIQDLSPAALTPNRVIVADANGVLSEFDFTGQPAGNTIVWNGANFTIGVAGDNWGTQSAAVNGPLIGNGTAGSPLGLTAGGAAGQVLTWNGANWVSLAVPSSADNWGTQTAVVSGPITGNGTAGSPLGLTAGGAAGQVLTWNGVNWVSQAVPSSADNWGTQTAAVSGPITGNGTAGSPLGLTAGGAAGQVLTWNGVNWVSQAVPSSADNWGTQVAAVNGPLTGNGTAGSPLGLTAGGAAGQVLTWNGVNWVSQAVPSSADNWGTQVAVSAGPLTGTGVAGTPLTFANGTANGQVWQWNGAAWVLNTISGDDWGTQVANTSGPITGDGDATPITFANGTANGQVWQWNGAAWVLNTISGDDWGTQVASTSGPITGDGDATPITLANGTANGQVWQWNGAAWVLATIAGADNWGTQVAVSAGPLTGTGVVGTPLTFANGTANGQVWQWNGAAWVLATISGADNWGTQVAVSAGPLTGTGVAGTPLTFANGTANGQVWQWNGAAWVLATIAGADNWGTQVAAVTGPITGDGTAGNPLGLVAGGANGHVLTWNGAAWVSQAPGVGADNWGTQVAVSAGPLTGTGVAGTPLTFANGTANGQVWQWNGAAWVLATIAGADNWGTQTAAVNGPITGNGTAGSPLGLIAGGAAGQVLTWNGAAWVSQAVPSSADNWGTQVAAVNGPITGNGTAGSPLGLIAGGAAGQVLTWNGAAWVSQAVPSSADNWGTQVAVSAGPLTGTGVAGTPLTFANGTANGQVWQWNGAAWVLATIAGADNWGTQVAAVTGPITGNGTAGSPLGLIAGGANGHVLTWNGAAWVSQAPGSGADNWGTQVAVSAGPLTGTGVAGTPLTFANGTANGQVWQWNGAAWVLATIPAPVAGNYTSLNANVVITGGAGAVLGAGTTIDITDGNLNAGSGIAVANGTGAVLGAGTTVSLVNGTADGHILIWDQPTASWVLSANGAAAGQVLTWNGTNWAPANAAAPTGANLTTTTAGVTITGGTGAVLTAATVDVALNSNTSNGLVLAGAGNNNMAWATNAAGVPAWRPFLSSVTTSGPLQGDGSVGNPVTFDPGTADGQVWLWDGAAWILSTLPSLVDVADIDGLIGTYNAATNVLDIDALVNNGLSISAGDSIGLGGTLVRNTTVDMAGARLVWNNAGRFGIGDITTGAIINKFQVENGATGVTATAAALINNTNTAATHGLSGFTNSNTATTAALRGEHLHATNTVYGVAGQVGTTNRNAAGVFGNATSNAYGVFGQNANAAANGGIGVGGTSLTSQGVYAQTASTTDVAVTIGATAFTGAAGLFAYSTNAGGSGAMLVGDGMSLAADMNYLLNGTGSNNNGFDIGSFHWAASGVSTQAIGTFTTYNGASFGIASLGVGFAGFFPVANVDMGGFYSAFDWGVAGICDLTFGAAGVQGEGFQGVVGLMTDPAGWGIITPDDFFAGGFKLFTIDHPEDPANKFLHHFCIESNAPLNMYQGTVAFDSNGEAVVELPSYFETINTDFSYQLTPIGGFAQVYVKSKIQNNRFVIAGGQPGLEVSWSVTARRNDRYAQNSNRDDQDWSFKPAHQRGLYVHPELWGQSSELDMFPSAANRGQTQSRLTQNRQQDRTQQVRPGTQVPAHLQTRWNQQQNSRPANNTARPATQQPVVPTFGLHSDASRPSNDGIIR